MKNMMYAKRTREQMNKDLSCALSVVKLSTGVTNNATRMVMNDALDALTGKGKGNGKQFYHKNFRGKCKWSFMQAFKAFDQHDSKLKVELFHVSDLLPSARKQYGNITDSDYFDFWAAHGSKAYEQEHKWVSSLENKYRVSLVHHHIPNAEVIAKVFVAQACLEMCCSVYESALRAGSRDFGISYEILDKMFCNFYIRDVADWWKRGLEMIEPQIDGYVLEEVEERNIIQGIEQLHEAWSNPVLMYQSEMDAAQAFDEIWRTKGEMKKKLGEIQNVLASAERIMANR